MSISSYYMSEEGEDSPFICSAARENGMLRCHDVPASSEGGVECALDAPVASSAAAVVAAGGANGCVNWNQYYNVCRPGDNNPHKGSVSFDNIAYAWIAIFQVITLEGWVDIMYYVMDAHSFYNFIYFILLIIVGSFFMINLCLVVIATQFSETKQRENALMREQRARYMSNDSTLASYSEPGSCYEEMLRYISHLYRKLRRRVQRIYSGCKRRKKVNPNGGGGAGGNGGGASGHGLARAGGGNGGQHAPLAASPSTTEHGLEELEMRSMAGMGALLGRLNGGMNYPTILPSFVCSYGSKTPPPHTKHCGPSPDHHPPHHLASQHTDTLSKLHQLMGQHSRQRLLYQLAGVGGPRGGDADGLHHDYTQGTELRGGRGRSSRRRGNGNAPKSKNRVVLLWRSFRNKLKRIVDSKYFNQGIMIAILVNTLSMGIEYHQQPEELTDVLEISNIVFTSMFVLEMVFKLLAFGLFGYIRNPVWEIIGQAEGGLSVLRTFRLLRVLKLVRFLPALRRQLVVLMKTMDNVATFCMLLMLFIFTFSILGMHLFGCKFSMQTENGDTIPDRKNFDSLLWAIVTVFQILTQEDWNVVLYNGMASTSPLAALYFVALMSFGNYVLFNLLVAILVEGFQAESDDDKKSDNFEEDEKVEQLRDTELKMYSLMMTANGHVDLHGTLAPPIIMRTAATPMPTPKSSVGGESVLGEGLPFGEAGPCLGGAGYFSEADGVHRGESCHGSPAFGEPSTAYDQRSLVSSPDGRSPLALRSWGSRRSSWNSLGRAPSLKRRDASGECESLLEVETGERGRRCWRRRPGHLELMQAGALGPSAAAEYGDCNGGSLTYDPSVTVDLKDNFSPEDDIDDDSSLCFRLKKELLNKKPRWCRDHDDWALYLFSPHNSPDIQPQSTERVFLSVSNYVFTVIFLAEMAVKSYLQSSWNVLDGVLVFVSLVDILVSMASTGGNRILGILRVLRLLRTLRPLRVISRAPGLKLVVETLITSLRPIGNIVLICCAFFIVFGILGVQLFKGKFYQCEGLDTRNITNKSDCALASYRWIRRKYNFDNLGQALMALFVLSCKDGWVNIMYDGLDAVGVDQQPVRNHNPWMLLYFISFLLIVSFFVLNMFVGVVVENFHKCRQDQEEEESRLREEKRLRMMEKKRRSKENGGAGSVQLSTGKTVSAAYHLCNGEAKRELSVSVDNKRLEHQLAPKYLGVRLDRTLSYKRHLEE
ncbi:hypothetical protein NHX12_031571, partial [Muraenolepis orangiensis]